MDIVSDEALEQLVRQVAQTLTERGWQLSAAESCTGGWLGKCCTDLAGSSAWFERGFITYSNQSKQDLLNVNAATLTQFGAVSEQTAIEMAEGALAESMADITVAITGIAGPDGGSLNKPVGTVCFAWSRKYSAVETQVCQFEGDRDAVRRQAVKQALKGIIKNARD